MAAQDVHSLLSCVIKKVSHRNDNVSNSFLFLDSLDLSVGYSNEMKNKLNF